MSKLTKVKTVRGPYKRYYHDPNVAIPDRTRYHYLSQMNQQSFSSLSFINNNNNIIRRTRVAMFPNIQETDNSQSNINNQQQQQQYQFTNQANQVPLHSSTSQSYLQNNKETGETYILETIDESQNINDCDLSFSEIDIESDQNVEFADIASTAINKEELAAAFLASFYSGRTTQASLKDYLELSNIYSNIKLPTSFDGLANILFENKKKFIHKKIWYCGVCLKKFEKNHVNQNSRTCETCKTR